MIEYGILGATLAQIKCAHGFRLVQKHSKVNINSLAKLIEKGMVIMHVSKHTIFCQAYAQIWQKVSALGTTLAQITCQHGSRLLQKKSNVKINPLTGFTTPEMGIIHLLSIQAHHFLPSLCLNLAKMGSFGATVAQIPRVHGFRLLQK